SLDRAQPEWAAADNGHYRPRRNHGERSGRGRPESRHADAAQDHAKVNGVRLCHYGDDPFLESDHQLGETTDVRVRVHGSAVSQVSYGRKVPRKVAPEQLAHIGASAQ